MLPGRGLEIDDGRIVAVSDGGPPPTVRAARVEELPGRYVMPGLWDMHVHVLWDDGVADAFLPVFTRAGITGVRDMGGDLEVLARVRRAGDPAWPRIVAAGKVLDGPQPVDPSISEAAASAMESRAAVQRLRAGGADFLKVYTLLPSEAFFAAAELARFRSLQVVGHVPAELTPLAAAQGGLASIEHLREELGGLCAGLAAPECEALPERLAALGTHVTPTWVMVEAKAVPGYVAAGRQVPGLDSLPAAVAGYWRHAVETQRARGEEHFRRRREILAGHAEMMERLAAAGVPFLVGTDTGNPWVLPGESLHRELARIADVLTPRAALTAATLGAARFLGLEDSGRIAPGYAADLVVLDADPLADVRNASRVVAVVRAGRWIEVGEGE